MATLADLVAPKPEPKGRTMLRDLVRGFNREAVAGVLGAPVDMANTLANLLIAGGGLAAHKAGLINQPPDLIDPARAVGSSDWIYNRLPAQPAMTGSGAETAGRLVGAIASPPAIVATAPRTLGSLVRYGMERAPKAAENYVRSLGGLTDAIVYHGSPYKFDAFDMSKIGTGEGAQAYGHGLYFAESPEVAKTYITPGLGQNMDQKIVRRIAQELGTRDPEKVFLAVQNYFAEAPKRPASAELIKSAGDVKRLLDSGALYTVDLPDSAIARMLDWDKPLSQQSKQVREGLAALDPDLYSPKGGDYDPSELGQMIYQRLMNQKRDYAITSGRNAQTTLPASQTMASQDLLSFGIPGIRYLDGVSRGAGAGTSNYVVFDDKLPKILKRE